MLIHPRNIATAKLSDGSIIFQFHGGRRIGRLRTANGLDHFVELLKKPGAITLGEWRRAAR